MLPFLSWGIESAGPWYTSAFVRGLFVSLLRAGLWLVFPNLIFGSGNCKCFLETNEKNQSRIMYSASALLAGGQSSDGRGQQAVSVLRLGAHLSVPTYGL